MSDKAVVYIKHDDNPHVPVTVRLDWLSNGKIKPCLYWTPDGSCYEIKHIYEMTPLAFLKDKGEGVRFKVRATLIETPEPYADYQFCQHEVYLYLADNFFYGRNIIDDRYGHDGKEFVPVTLDVFPDCKYELISFSVQEQQYVVEKTIAVEPRGSFQAGGIGVWHKVKAQRASVDGGDPKSHNYDIRISALYFEINKWFVRVNAA